MHTYLIELVLDNSATVWNKDTQKSNTSSMLVSVKVNNYDGKLLHVKLSLHLLQ